MSRWPVGQRTLMAASRRATGAVDVNPATPVLNVAASLGSTSARGAAARWQTVVALSAAVTLSVSTGTRKLTTLCAVVGQLAVTRRRVRRLV